MKKDQQLRSMLNIETNPAVRNVLIALLNDEIIKHNKRFSKVRQINNNNLDRGNQEILQQHPKMMEIIAVRKFHRMEDLIGMALTIETFVPELNIIHEYSASA